MEPSRSVNQRDPTSKRCSQDVEAGQRVPAAHRVPHLSHQLLHRRSHHDCSTIPRFEMRAIPHGCIASMHSIHFRLSSIPLLSVFVS
jgi:hypothetical protein